jgi:hypothetical protein
MNDVKKLIGLVLAVGLVIVLCVAFARRAETETDDLKIRFVNETGAEITDITLKERIGALHQEWSIGTLASGGKSELTMTTVVKDGNPDLDFLYTSGSTRYRTLFLEKGDRTITFRLDAGNNVITDVTGRQS